MSAQTAESICRAGSVDRSASPQQSPALPRPKASFAGGLQPRPASLEPPCPTAGLDRHARAEQLVAGTEPEEGH